MWYFIFFFWLKMISHSGQSGILSAVGHIEFSSSLIRCLLQLLGLLKCSVYMHSAQLPQHLRTYQYSYQLIILSPQFWRTSSDLQTKCSLIQNNTFFNNKLCLSFLAMFWRQLAHSQPLNFSMTTCVYKFFLCPWHQRISFVVDLPIQPK